MGKFQFGLKFGPADRVEKSPDYMKIFQPGLKLKSEVNPGRNLSVAFVLAISIFPRLSIISSDQDEIFSCDYMGFFSPGSSNQAEAFSTRSRAPFFKYFVRRPSWNFSPG